MLQIRPSKFGGSFNIERNLADGYFRYSNDVPKGSIPIFISEQGIDRGRHAISTQYLSKSGAAGNRGTGTDDTEEQASRIRGINQVLERRRELVYE